MPVKTEAMIDCYCLCMLCGFNLTDFGRPLGPPPPERRPPPPTFVERPPYSFDQFGRPLFAPPASGPPPMWEQRYVRNLSVHRLTLLFV